MQIRLPSKEKWIPAIRKKLGYKLVPIQISLIYFLISFFWILFSDRIANRISGEKDVIIAISMYKGWFYVSAVAVIIYVLLVRVFKTVERADRKLEESYEKLKKAQAIAHIGNWELNVATGRIWVSDETVRIFGYPEQTTILSLYQMEEAFHPNDRVNMMEMFQELIRDGKPFNREFPVRRPSDGEERVICAIGEVECDKSGNPHKLLGVVEDITEQKKMQEIQEMLKVSEQRFSDIASTVDEAFWIWEKGGFVYMSPAFEKIWGRSRQELLNGEYNIADTLHPDELQDMDITIKQNRELYKEIWTIAYRVVRPDGEIRWIDSKRYPVLDADGNLIRYIGIARDITSLKESEEQLKQAKEQADAANRAKSQFLANMSHEIRTPMNGMLGMIQLAQMVDSRDEQEEYLQLAKKSADSMLRVINDILDYSKIEAGKMLITKAEFHVREILDDVITLFSVVAKQKNIEIRYRIDGIIPECLVGDAIRLRQILSNLVGNAVKFTDAGQIDLTVKRKSSTAKSTELIFSVEDTGIGISQENMQYLFKSFSQIDDSYTKRYHGTGLGLAISKSLAEAMGGSIGVESEEGRGSRFWFTVQLDNTQYNEGQQGGATAQTSVPVISARLMHRKVLVAEDDKVNQKVIERILVKAGVDPVFAENGAEAVERYREQSFDLILMDVQMPKMDGISAASEIRVLERNSSGHVPIIALTAYATSPDKQRCLEAGMNYFVTKPVDLKLLLRTMEEAVI